jgi:hypothetical protein
MSAAQLSELYEKYGQPSGRQLRFAAIREGLQVSAKQADDFVKGQAESQIFAKRPVSDGATASRGPGEEYQADILDFKATELDTGKVVLVVLDPFNRRLRLSGALPNKKPTTVRDAFLSILSDDFPPPKSITTDSGNEFKTHFETMLRQEQIVHKFRRGINSLARVDRVIGTMRKKLAQRLLRVGSKRWDKEIASVEAQYNSRLNLALGATPDDAVKDDKVGKIVRFRLLQENADAFAKNTEANRVKEEAVREAGAFRQVVDRQAFMRGDKPTFGPLKRVQSVERGQVTGTDGKTVSIKEIRAVPSSTQDVAIPDSRNRGLRDARLKEDLKEFAKDLYDALSDQPIAATAAARMMGPEFQRAKPSTLLFTQFLALYPQLFKVEGEGPGKRVRRIRRRIRGKQPPLG